MTDVEADSDGNDARSGAQRLDKWLWFARVAKTRTLSSSLVSEGKVRVNGLKVVKPAHTVKPGDTVTIIMRQRMRVLKVAGIGSRRGSADVAALLFVDLSPVAVSKRDGGVGDNGPHAMDAGREPGSGRPTKRERREMERFKFRSS